jgi:hypothetical protein
MRLSIKGIAACVAGSAYVTGLITLQFMEMVAAPLPEYISNRLQCPEGQNAYSLHAQFQFGKMVLLPSYDFGEGCLPPNLQWPNLQIKSLTQG